MRVAPLLVAAAQCAAAFAQGPVPLTLEGAESKALAANPHVRAAHLDAAAAAERVAEARGRHFGELDLLASYDNFESPRLVRPMSIDLFASPAAGFSQLPWAATQVHYGVAFELPLLAAGSLREGDRIAALGQSAAERTAEFSREGIRTNVRAAYRNALLVRHAREAAQAYCDALERDEKDAQLKVKLGALAPVDEAKLAYAVRGAEAQLAALAAQERTAQAVVAAYMGEDLPEGGYELADVTSEPKMPAAGHDLANALAGRLDLQAVRDGTRIAEHKKALAHDAFGPRLSLAGDWLRNDAPGFSRALDTHEIFLNLKLPLFDGLRRVHSLKEAEIEVEAAREREKAKELEVSTQVVDAQGRVEAARAQLEAGKAQRALGAEVARVEDLKLEQGTGNMEDYLKARAEQLRGETGYWQGLYALQDAVDYLDFVSAQGGWHEHE